MREKGVYNSTARGRDAAGLRPGVRLCVIKNMELKQ